MTEKEEHIHIMVTSELKEALQEKAKEDMRNVSSLVRKICRDYIERSND